MHTHLLNQLLNQQHLSRSEAHQLMDDVLAGEVPAPVLSALLMALRLQGETEAELTGFAQSLRQHATPIQLPTHLKVIDTCGTGGDGHGTFNVSTAVGIVLASLDIPVLKHGNRAVSSAAGSADVLEALGIPLQTDPQRSVQTLNTHHFAFCYAPAFHPTLKHVGALRRQLKTRTVFNLLGPLCNPGAVRQQILGVSTPHLVYTLAQVLQNLGCESALVLCAEDGMDELSLNSPTQAVHLKRGHLQSRRFCPEDAGLSRAPLAAVKGGDAQHNAQILQAIFHGEGGQLQPKYQREFAQAPRQLVLYNTAAALLTYGITEDLKLGVALAADAIDKGDVARKLSALQADANTAAETHSDLSKTDRAKTNSAAESISTPSTHEVAA